LEALSVPTLLIAAAATIAGCVVRGFTGFGAAMFQVPMFALLFPAPQAVATAAGLGALASLQLLPGAARHAQWRQVGTLTVFALLTIPLGSLVLLTLDPDLMRRAISAMVLALVPLLASGLRLPVAPGPWSAGGVGALSGLINGATGVGGPPVVLYLLAGPNPANINRANLIGYYTFLNGGTCLSLLLHGVFTRSVLWYVLALWPVQIVSLWLGSWLFRRASDRIYRRIALAILLAVALFGLLYTR
jgi:hypothetical protein